MKNLLLALVALPWLIGCSDPTRVRMGKPSSAKTEEPSSAKTEEPSSAKTEEPSSAKTEEVLESQEKEPLAAGYGRIRLIEESTDGSIRRARWKVEFGPGSGVLTYKANLMRTGGRDGGFGEKSTKPGEEMTNLEILYEEEKITGEDVLNLVDVVGQGRSLSDAILEKDQEFKKATAYHIKLRLEFEEGSSSSMSSHMPGPANGTWKFATSGFGYCDGEFTTFRLGEELRLAHRLWWDGSSLKQSGSGPTGEIEVDGKMIDIKDYPGWAWLCVVKLGAEK